MRSWTTVSADIRSEDKYKVLGVEATASDADINAAYRKLALQHHPDRNPRNKEQAEKNFKKLTEAVEVLRDPEKRKDYDVSRRAGLAQGNGHDTFSSRMPRGTTSTGEQANGGFNASYRGKDSHSAFSAGGSFTRMSGKVGMSGGIRSGSAFPNMDRPERQTHSGRKDASDDGLVGQAFFGGGMAGVGNGGMGGMGSSPAVPNTDRPKRQTRAAKKDASDDGLVFQAFFGSGMDGVGNMHHGFPSENAFPKMGSERRPIAASPARPCQRAAQNKALPARPSQPLARTSPRAAPVKALASASTRPFQPPARTSPRAGQIKALPSASVGPPRRARRTV